MLLLYVELAYPIDSRLISAGDCIKWCFALLIDAAKEGSDWSLLNDLKSMNFGLLGSNGGFGRKVVGGLVFLSSYESFDIKLLLNEY
jgi:hypothetical protein